MTCARLPKLRYLCVSQFGGDGFLDLGGLGRQSARDELERLLEERAGDEKFERWARRALTRVDDE